MMSFAWLEWGLQLALLGLLGAAIPFAIRLERALREIRKDRTAMETSAQGLSEAAGAAESAILRLRATAELAGRQVQERVTAAEPLRAIAPHLDAANVDLKSFSDAFYKKICGARLQPVQQSPIDVDHPNVDKCHTRQERQTSLLRRLIRVALHRIPTHLQQSQLRAECGCEK